MTACIDDQGSLSHIFVAVAIHYPATLLPMQLAHTHPTMPCLTCGSLNCSHAHACVKGVINSPLPSWSCSLLFAFVSTFHSLIPRYCILCAIDSFAWIIMTSGIVMLTCKMTWQIYSMEDRSTPPPHAAFDYD